MKTITTTPELQQLIDAWYQAKEVEKNWSEYRRQVEDQILQANPELIASLDSALDSSTSLSQAALIGSLKVETKREVVLDQDATAHVIAAHPDLWLSLFKATYSTVSSRALFAVMSAGSPVATAVKELVTFKKSRPYFSVAK